MPARSARYPITPISQGIVLACVIAFMAGLPGCGGDGDSTVRVPFDGLPSPDGRGGSGDGGAPGADLPPGGDGSPEESGLGDGPAGEGESLFAFEPEEVYSLEPVLIEGSETSALLLSDVDGDDDLELVTSDRDGVKLRDIGTRAFGAATLLRDARASALAAGDLDGDADVDLVLGFFKEPVVVGLSRGAADEVLFNDGAGTLVDSGQRLGRSFTRALALEDVDLDGDLDLIAGAIGANPVRLNDGRGFFPVDRDFLGEYRTVALATGDIDLDGRVDLVTGNEAEVFFGGVIAGEPDRQWFSSVARGFTGARPIGDVRTVAVALADFDGDGDLDYITLSRFRGLLFVNDGAGNLLLAGPILQSGAETLSLVAGDLDGDGDVDLVEGTESGARVWLNDGAAHFSGSSIFLASAALALVLGDLDRDLDLDLVTANRDGVRIWTNQTSVFVAESPGVERTE